MLGRKYLARHAKRPIYQTQLDVIPKGMHENGAGKARDRVSRESTRVEVSLDICILWVVKLKLFFSRVWR